MDSRFRGNDGTRTGNDGMDPGGQNSVVPAKAGTHVDFAGPGQRLPPGPRYRDMRQPAVYILASQPRGTLYIGVTSDLPRRIEAHRADTADGFTRKHGVKTLVYMESHESMEAAIVREKQLKKWNRLWKIELIEKGNPEWRDLGAEI